MAKSRIKNNKKIHNKSGGLQAEIGRLIREANKIAFKSLSTARKAFEAPLIKIEKVLKSDPKNIDALLMKGNIIDLYFSSLMEIHEVARSCYEEVLVFTPSNVCALIDMGDWYSIEGKYNKAIRYYDKAISFLKQGKFYRSLKKEFEEAYIGKTSALKYSKKHREAQQCAVEGLQHCPNSRVLRSWASGN